MNASPRRTACVLFGGASSEHEVSLRSAATVLRGVPRDRFDVVMLGITKDGRWFLYSGAVEDIEENRWQAHPDNKPAILSPDRSHGGVAVLDGSARFIPVDVVFPALHGKNGEDGTIQGLLELAGIPCAGCGVLASALCMDKALAHTVLTSAGIPKTALVSLCKSDTRDLDALAARLEPLLGYPMFVKPANAGSSVGVTKVSAKDGLAAALRLAFEHDTKAVVEKAVAGQEVECAVMGNDDPVAAARLGEIVAPGGVYDYASKYLNDDAGLYIPARIAPETAERVRALAVKAYRALGCRGLARVDFFVQADGGIILNEVNTIPGFTSISMFPRLFLDQGLSLTGLVGHLLDYALES